MELHVGLDVSLESTSVCIVDEVGKKVLEVSVASDPEAICIALRPHVSCTKFAVNLRQIFKRRF